MGDDFKSLSEKDLHGIISDPASLDIARRIKAKAELERREQDARKESGWGWQRKYGFWGLVFAFIAVLAALAVVPEVRHWARLGRQSVVSTPAPREPKPVATTTISNPDRRAVTAPPVELTKSINKKLSRPTPKATHARTAMPPPVGQPDMSGVYCEKSDHPLPSGQTSNCQDLEISNNRFVGSTSVFENAGKADRVLISGARVTSPPDGDATVVRTFPGSESSNITITDPVVSGNPTHQLPSDTPAAIGVDKGQSVNQVLIQGNNICDGEPTLSNRGDIKDFTVRDNKSIPCGWFHFLDAIQMHRDSIDRIVSNWTTKMEGMWSGLPEVEKDRNRKELFEIEQRLLAAAVDADEFSKLLLQLRTEPPHFKMPD